MAEELKACPFCGRIPKTSHRPESEASGGGHVAFVVCYCGGYASTAHQMGHAETVQAAIAEVVEKWNTRAQLPSQGGEAVEVVKLHHMARSDGDGLLRWMTGRFMSDCELYASPNFESIREPLMTVAQHQRILAASVGSADHVAWREHSVNYAKGEKCPETIETLQAAWDRDQELINDMRHEIARHKTRINRLEQRHSADKVAELGAVFDSVRELIREELSNAYHERKTTDEALDAIRALLAKTHPADQVVDDLTMVKVSRELLQDLRDLAFDQVEHHRAAMGAYKQTRQSAMDSVLAQADALLRT